MSIEDYDGDIEYAAYRAGYQYGTIHPEAGGGVSAKALDLYPDNQTLRIEWDRGLAHCIANRALGHDVTILYEHEMYWIEDPAALVTELTEERKNRERYRKVLFEMSEGLDRALDGIAFAGENYVDAVERLVALLKAARARVAELEGIIRGMTPCYFCGRPLGEGCKCQYQP